MPDVILPVLDEAEALRWVLERVPNDYQPIVVDNGSTDGSGTIARRAGARVVVEMQRGFGAACYSGLLAARADVVCFMDCDGSLDPKLLEEVARPILDDGADLALGERVPQRGAWPLHARLANKALMLDVRRRTGLKLRDMGPMRAARRTDLLALGIVDRRFGWPLEMVMRAWRAGWRVVEVPVAYRARSGRSKVTGTFAGTLRTARDMARVLT
ncbi:glycosyltransferase family 2 protein [soil metagenome]